MLKLILTTCLLFIFSDHNAQSDHDQIINSIHKYHEEVCQNKNGEKADILNINLEKDIASVKTALYLSEEERVIYQFFLLNRHKESWFIVSQNSSNILEKRFSKKILFVVSNAHYHGQSEINTANHYFEIILPYDEFVQAGYEVDFVSPKGGAIPLGYINYTYSTSERYIFDSDFMYQLQNTKRPEDVKSSDYAAIFYCGGGAAMYGVPENVEIQKIASEIYEKEGVVSSICHGAAGIVNIKKSDGEYLIAGKKVNGFPDKFEDKEADYYQEFPFSIEEKMKERGGHFNYSQEGWDQFYQVDGRIMTAQDPTGGRTIVKKIIEKLNNTTSKL